MKFSSEQSEEEMTFDINVIPLIDVLLVLLIFFMVSASFVASGGLDVKLPSSTAQSKNRNDDSLRVNVLRDGQIQFDGKTLAVTALAETLRSKAGSNPNATVVIRADEKAEHGFVVEAMNAAKEAGLEKVAIATTLKPTQN